MSVPAGGPDGPWAPLRATAFRNLWLASLASNFGALIHGVGAAWLMTSLSPSPLMVALVQTATNLPTFLLALPAGALADVVDRRKLLLLTQSWMRSLFGVTRPIELWWGIQPISAGVFGVPVGFAVIVVVSLLTRRPGPQVMDLVNHVRYPGALPHSPEKRQLGAPWKGGL
jgi:MFS family permease